VDHVFVPRASVERFVALAREIVPSRYPNLDSPDYTSVVDHRAFLRLKSALDEAREQGATVLPLIEPAFDIERHRIAPHIVVGAPEASQLMQREIFGPILPVLPYDDLDAVIARINAGPRPLAVYPFSDRRDRIERVIERVMSGGVTVNDALMHVGQEELPFGGVGESGMGHYHGQEGFNTFSKLRPVFTQARWSSLALMMPPYGRMADRVLRFLLR
jgi:coniferyl-aldehyde dehydrogenase